MNSAWPTKRAVVNVLIEIIIIIIIIKAICKAQDPLKKAANALSGSLKMLVSIYNMYHINNNAFSCVLKVLKLTTNYPVLIFVTITINFLDS